MTEKPAPVAPRPAASILLLRDGPAGLETFMVVRHHQIDFASGALVFPGGRMEAADAEIVASVAAVADRGGRGQRPRLQEGAESLRDARYGPRHGGRGATAATSRPARPLQGRGDPRGVRGMRGAAGESRGRGRVRRRPPGRPRSTAPRPSPISWRGKGSRRRSTRWCRSPTGSRPTSCRSASTPISSWRWPPPTRRSSTTGARRSIRSGSRRRQALAEHGQAASSSCSRPTATCGSLRPMRTPPPRSPPPGRRPS